MQYRLHSLKGYTIHATDGELGKVCDFFFDDATWTIRYLVVETGNWLLGRKVLISLAALGKPLWETRQFPVNLTCDQVRHSPDIDTDMPVHRQHEVDLHSYYEWPQYWNLNYGGTFGITLFPLFENPFPLNSEESAKTEDPHLRSMIHVSGYRIHALDGEIGHVTDFIMNDANWALRYLIVQTETWLINKMVLIAPRVIRDVNWAESSVHVRLSKQAVIDSFEFEPWKTIQREYADACK